MQEIDYYDFLDKALNLTRFLPFKIQPYFKQILELNNNLERSKNKYRKAFRKYLLEETEQMKLKIIKIEKEVDFRFSKKQKKIEKLAKIIGKIHAEIFNTPGLNKLPEITKPIKMGPCLVSTNFTRENLNKEEIVCICKKGVYGQMILCEYNLCPIGWYHLNCTSLRKPPKLNFICKICTSSKIFK